MKKMFVLVLAIAMLAACGPANPADAQAEVIWLVRPNEREQQWQAGVIRAFEEQQPTIKIRLEVVPPEEYDSRMQVMTAAGTPPDIFSHWGTAGFRDYYQRGMIADLTPFIERDEFNLDDFDPSSMGLVTVGGRVFGLPIQISGSYLLYNKDLFDQTGVAYPPVDWDNASWTYEAFLEKCAALTNAESGVFGCGMDLRPYDAYAWLWGQDLFPVKAYQTGFSDAAFLDQPAVIDAFQSLQDIAWKEHLLPTPAQVEELGGVDLFEAQKAAVLLNGGTDWWNYRHVNGLRWGIAALPYASPGRRTVTFTDPWMLSSKSRYPEEAWLFLKFLAERPQQEAWMTATGAPPARMSLNARWYLMFPGIAPEELAQAHQGALKYGGETPEHTLVRYDMINRVLAAAVEPVLNNQKDAEEALLDANPRLVEALKRIQAEYKRQKLEE